MAGKIRSLVARTSLSVIIAIFGLVPAMSLVTYADCTPPDTSSQPGVHVPNGADAALYHYDCTSGMWVSQYYTFDPNTGNVTYNQPIYYTYNPRTGNYDYTVYIYSAPNGDYEPYSSSVSTPPAGAVVVGAPTPQPSSDPSGGSGSDPSISNTGDNSNNTINDNGGGDTSINGTGANSTNTINASGNNVLATTNNNLLSIANLLNSQATSGNAVVIGNTVGGDAASGNAMDEATIMNMLQSSSNVLGSGNVVTFVKNIDGNVNGDLLFDPSALGQVQPAVAPSGNNNITFNNQTNANINNNVNLGAHSGDATVSQNNSGGNATSGAAEAIANVVNLIDSAVSAGKSFVGTININGNLNGDILIPPSFINQLIATNVPTITITNTGASSNNTVNDNHTNTVNATNTNNEGINNNVHSTSSSGTANVSGNTSGGDATSGNAANSITAFNLTGSNVIGANDLLVFVNVLGTWVGMIVNAPPGATAAELCGGGCSVNNTGAGSNNTINSNGSNTVNSHNTNNLGITNNINLGAQSGNTNVTGNTKGGNATSGDAKTGANLLNVENSSFSLSNWFGILFINVFGTWNGSFGINTAAGDPAASPTTNGAAGAPAPALFFRFIPTGGSGFDFSELPAGFGSASGSDTAGDSSGTILAAHTIAGTKAPTPGLSAPHSSFGKTAGIITACCLLYIALDALYTRRHTHKVH